MLLVREVMYCKPGKVRPLVEKFVAMSGLMEKAGQGFPGAVKVSEEPSSTAGGNPSGVHSVAGAVRLVLYWPRALPHRMSGDSRLRAVTRPPTQQPDAPHDRPPIRYSNPAVAGNA